MEISDEAKGQDPTQSVQSWYCVHNFLSTLKFLRWVSLLY